MNLSVIVWRRSTRSTGNGGQCVEVATLPDRVMIRDSKDRHGPTLVVSRDQWCAFLASLDRASLDR